MNPALNYLVTGAVLVFLLLFFAAVGYIVFRVLRYGERYFRDTGEPLGAPPPPPAPPEPPPRPSRRGRRRR